MKPESSRYEYRIDHEDGVGYLTVAGRVTGKVLCSGIRELVADPEWRRGYGILWDCRGVTELIFLLEDAEAIMDLHFQLAARMGRGRGAIVVKRPLDAEIATLLVVRARKFGRDRRVFYDMQKALAWLKYEELTDVPQ